LARRGDSLLPPVKLETWTDPSGAAPQTLVDESLGLPFAYKRDQVLRGTIWKPVLEEFPAWTQLIKQSAEGARELIKESELLTTRVEAALQAARAETAKRHSILWARSLRLPTERTREAATIEFEFEQAVAEALIAGIQQPSVRMVASGVCVLWPEGNF
jgi:ATP-dependent helicase HepA